MNIQFYIQQLCLSRVVCICLFFFIFPSVALTQADINAPEIFFSQPEDSNDLFEIKVTDDVSVAKVLLYFRLSDKGEFESRPMRESAGGVYKTKLTLTKSAKNEVSFYFVALDRAGNRTFKGLEFNPYKRNVSGNSTSGKNSRTMWLIAGAGVLLLGALLSGGSSGDGGVPPTSQCGDSGCTITLTPTLTLPD